MVPRPQRRDREEDTVARMALSHGTRGKDVTMIKGDSYCLR